MTELLAQTIQSLLSPITKPIRTEVSNLALRLLVATVFSTLAVFSGVHAIQALRLVIQELVFGPQIEIAAFSLLALAFIGIVFAVLRRKPKPAQPTVDLNTLILQFLEGLLEGATNKKEAPTKEPRT